MKPRYIRTQILIIIIGSLFLHSCKEKDDKDFIIDLLTTAKTGNLESIKKYLSFEYETKEHLYSQAEKLIADMKDTKIPAKEKIRSTINDLDFPAYRFSIEGKDTYYMIGLMKRGNRTSIIHLDRIH